MVYVIWHAPCDFDGGATVVVGVKKAELAGSVGTVGSWAGP